MAFGRDQTDRRFAHFCRTGDPDALGDVFDRTAGRLMRIALWLARDRADAEDLLQRTFLQAIETRQQFRQGEAVLPWLMGLLANQARKLRRERDRTLLLRPQPDHVVDPEVEVATGELEAAVRVVRQRLGEPYEQVLQLHLEQGLNAREIAERLDRPAGTVRTQLVRALDLLRKKLPKGFVAGLAAIAAVEAEALAMVRTTVLAAAETAAPLSATTAVTIGGVLVAKKAMVVLPVLVLLVGGVGAWMAWPPPPAMAPLMQPFVAANATAIDQGEPAQHATPATVDPRQRVEAQIDTGEPGFAVLRVAVRWQHDGTPARGIGIHLQPKRTPVVHSRHAITGEDGIAELRHIAPGGYLVISPYLLGAFVPDASGPASTEEVELGAGQQLAIQATAVQASTASGRVVDAEGRPVAGARICLSSPRQDWEVGRSDAQGTFTVPLQHHYLCARKEGHVPSLMLMLVPKGGPYRDVMLKLRGLTGRVHGVVRDARGAPVAWARVLVGLRGGAAVQSGASADQYQVTPVPEQLDTGRDGTFTACEVLPGDSTLWVWAEGFGPLQLGFTTVAGATTELAITLADAAVVTGAVRTAGGEPVAGAEVHFGDEQFHFPQALAVTGDDGRFRLGDLPAWPAGIELTASKGGLKAKARLSLRAGTTTEWNPVLDTGRTIRGSVRGPDGPLAGLQVGVVDPSQQRPERWHTTDGGGRFVLTHVGDTERTVRVAQGEDVALLDLHDVAPGRDDVVIELTLRQLPTARLRGRIVDPGRALTGAVHLVHEGNRFWHYQAAIDEATGTFTFRALPAARFRIDAFTHQAGEVPMGTVALEPHQERTLDDFVLQPSGSAEVLVTDVAGQPVADGHLTIRTPAGDQVRYLAFERGKAAFTHLQPGRYFAQIHATIRPVQALCAEFEVQSAAVTPVEVRGVPAANVTLRFRDAGPGDRNLTVAVCCTTGGRLAGFFQTYEENAHRLIARGRLPPGRYRADGRTSDGRRVDAEFEVGKDPPEQVITIDLPGR